MDRRSTLFLLIFGVLACEAIQGPQRPNSLGQTLRAQPIQCTDTSTNCAFWASIGECQRNNAWMIPNCGKSCNSACSQLPQPEPVAVQPSNTRSTTTTASSNSVSGTSSDSSPNVNPLLSAASTSSRIPAVDAQCPRGVQVIEIQTRAVPTAEQYRKVAQQQGCAIPNQPNQCDKNLCYHARYRTADGSCNHLSDSLKGAAYMPFLRMLGPNFEDGVNSMVGTQPNTRPNPRLLTRFLMSSPRSLPSAASSLVTAFGQFLMHDLMRNTLVNTCKCNTRGAHCANMPLAPGDRRQNQCIAFTRSLPMCGSGRNGRPRLAMNENTPLMDLSQVYASDPTTASRLRGGPFLASSQIRGTMFPPQTGTNLVTGDDRADLFAGMTALHVIFLRFHNTLVNRLQRINPRWNPDRLYREARKINGAVFQSFVYNQFLQVVLGSKISLIGTYSGFIEAADPQISHEFASAAARLHGTIQEVYPLVDSNFRTVGQYRFVEAVASTRRLFTSGVGLIIRGLIITPARKVGRLGNSMTELLFGGETDMLAVNVQRGRDYGIKNYLAYRELCGLGNFTFEDWKEVPDSAVRQRVSELYRSPEDVDLYIGGLLETPVDGGLLGPTFSCIFAEQVKRSRDGDRFFYKNQNIFTEAQRESIDKLTFGKVLCEVGDGFNRVQQDTFRIGSAANAVPCASLPGLNLELWRDQ